MPEYIYSIIIVVVVIIIAVILSKKRMGETWEGTLEKKKKNYGNEDGIDTYTLIFRTTEGKKKRVTINSLTEYEKWEIGEKAEKIKGQYHPTKKLQKDDSPSQLGS